MDAEYQWLPREEDLKSNYAYKYVILDNWAAISEIVPNLYLTSITALTEENLRKHKFDVLIDTCEQPFYKQPNVEYHTFRIEDKGTANLIAIMDPFADLVHDCLRKGRKVLVHCFGGSSRSGALVIAYLMKYHQLSLKEAFKLSRERRSAVRPSNGFFRQLIDYESHLFGKSSAKMSEYTSDANNITIEVPDFFITDHMKLVNEEVKYASQRFSYNY